MKRKKRRIIELAKRRKQSWKSLRKKRRCEFCGTKKHLTIDHIKQKSFEGTNNPSNLRILCFRCHKKRHKRKYNYNQKGGETWER
jgi:5-methylcytosine-specific restriction endonuclease McrA